MSHRALLVLINLLFAGIPFLSAQELRDLVFDTDFESGFAGQFHYDSIKDEWDLNLDNDNGDMSLPDSYRRTFHFRCSQAAGKHVKIRIDGVYWFCGNVSVASYDGENWFRLDPSKNTDTKIDLLVPDGQDQVFFSYTFPYDVSKKDLYLENISSSPFVTIDFIGQSVFSPDVPEWAQVIQLITITDETSQVEHKDSIWIHARIHPGEIPTSFIIEGLIDWLIADDSIQSRWLLDNCIFYIVPMANPSGVYLGNYRTNAASENLEAVWCLAKDPGDENPFPEVEALKFTLDQIHSGGTPVELALNLHSTMTQSDEGHFHFKHVYPSVSRIFEERQDYWINRFEETSTQFNNVNPRESQLSQCAFIESYLWNHYEDEVIALTLESTYLTRDSDNGIIEISDYRTLGSEMAQSIYALLMPSQYTLNSLQSGTETVTLIGKAYPANVTIQSSSKKQQIHLLPHSSESLSIDLLEGETVHIQSDHQLHAFLSQSSAIEELSFVSGGKDAVTESIMPHIPVGDWSATLIATNMSDSFASEFEVFADGSSTPVAVIMVEGNSTISMDARELGTSWLKLKGTAKIWNFRMVFSRAGVVSAALPLSPQLENTVYFPHIPADKANFWYGFVLTNTGDQQVEFIMNAYDNFGQEIGQKESTLAAFEKEVALLSDFWVELPDSASWLEIQSSEPLYGVMLFGTNNGRSLAGLPLSGNLHRHHHFPVLLQGESYWHGLALLNPNDKEIRLVVTPWSTSGEELASITLTCDARSRYVQTLDSLLGSSSDTISGARIDSSEAVLPLALVGEKSFNRIDGFLLEPIENKARTVSKIKQISQKTELHLR